MLNTFRTTFRTTLILLFLRQVFPQVGGIYQVFIRYLPGIPPLFERPSGSSPSRYLTCMLARPTREPNRVVGQECHLMGGVSRDRVRLSEIIFLKIIFMLYVERSSNSSLGVDRPGRSTSMTLLVLGQFVKWETRVLKFAV